MRFALATACCAALAGTALARAPAGRHVRSDERVAELEPRHQSAHPSSTHPHGPPAYTHSSAAPKPTTIIPQNKNTTKFKVDGTKIPEVTFDIGESYAGLLPISNEPDVSELYFWFFPSDNALAGDGEKGSRQE